MPTLTKQTQREHKCKALVLDSDSDALLMLQRTLENGGVDTTITWDCLEARNLVRTTSFDVMLIADHPPEISAEKTIRELRNRGTRGPCLVLQTASRELNKEEVLRLGAIGAVPKGNPSGVLEKVRSTCGGRGPSMTKG